MRILLVDDEKDSREAIAQFLNDLGHQITECDNGKEALTLFKEMPFPLVLTDLKMPHMSGLDLLRELRKLSYDPVVDVVLFTGYGDMESAIAALRAGAYDYLSKPINVSELAAVTDRIAEHQALRLENKELTKRFEERVAEETGNAKKEMDRLRKMCARISGVGGIGIFSESMRNVFSLAERFHTDRSIPILIEGETGTGKELVARFIHFGHGEVTTPFVALNCAAISPSIFESEFFGYEAGAFTGGNLKGQKGKIELAQRGTLLLDEIAEVPLDLQAKLLRFLQEKEFYRVGGLKKINSDVRIICATNQNLAELVSAGRFRGDLYFRLNGAQIYIPPLRDRREEIIPLARLFLDDCARNANKPFADISREAMKVLDSYSWPGNVRELKNNIARIVLTWDDTLVRAEHLDFLHHNPISNRDSHKSECSPIDINRFLLPPDGINLEKFISKLVRKALEMHKGNKAEAARFLGISRRRFYSRFKKAAEEF